MKQHSDVRAVHEESKSETKKKPICRPPKGALTVADAAICQWAFLLNRSKETLTFRFQGPECPKPQQVTLKVRGEIESSSDDNGQGYPAVPYRWEGKNGFIVADWAIRAPQRLHLLSYGDLEVDCGMLSLTMQAR
ncbi:MAG: hypothetical protein MK135_09850 [Polyangiaceae bacterium]|nr:hypothetical protein [Polyangiaceae bacterium]